MLPRMIDIIKNNGIATITGVDHLVCNAVISFVRSMAS